MSMYIEQVNIEHKSFQIQCMREHMGAETDLVNVVNRRKL